MSELTAEIVLACIRGCILHHSSFPNLGEFQLWGFPETGAGKSSDLTRNLSLLDQ